MKKIMLLVDNIVYTCGIVDFIPENLEKAKDEFKVDKFITKNNFKTLSNKRNNIIFEFLF